MNWSSLFNVKLVLTFYTHLSLVIWVCKDRSISVGEKLVPGLTEALMNFDREPEYQWLHNVSDRGQTQMAKTVYNLLIP